MGEDLEEGAGGAMGLAMEPWAPFMSASAYSCTILRSINSQLFQEDSMLSLAQKRKFHEQGFIKGLIYLTHKKASSV